MLNGFDEARALKWLKYYRRSESDDQIIVEKASKSFQMETCYTNERMIPIIEFMWKAHLESSH